LGERKKGICNAREGSGAAGPAHGIKEKFHPTAKVIPTGQPLDGEKERLGEREVEEKEIILRTCVKQSQRDSHF